MSSSRWNSPPRHQSRSRREDVSSRTSHDTPGQRSEPASLPFPKSHKTEGYERDTLDLFISAGFGQGFAAAPKVLGDLFESIIGAVYIDSGGDLEALWKVSSLLCLLFRVRLQTSEGAN